MYTSDVFATLSAYRYIIIPDLFRKYADKNMQYALWRKDYLFFGKEHYKFIQEHIDEESIRKDYPTYIADILIDELFEYAVTLYDDVESMFED